MQKATLVANIASVIATSHAPGAKGWLDKAPKHEQDELLGGYARMADWLRASRPDVIVGIANDHLLNFRLDNIPDWCVGTAKRWRGPAEWFRDWINVPEYEVAGHPELARTIVRDCARNGVRPWGRTGSGCRIDRCAGVLLLELGGAEIADG